MATTSTMLASLVVVLLPFAVLGSTCVSPDVKTETYTTTDGMASMDTVFVVEFSLKCQQKVENLNLYADINGRTVPATKTNKADNYQISFSEEHKNLPSGSYQVRLYDDEGYSALKKAQRSGDSESQIKPVHTFHISHPGVWKGPLLQSEFVASMVAILVWYFAYTAKAKLQSN
ncbi:translocon-associated protein subunit delta-like [Mytilus californianus]|uniref:translocon-associated protein subunit delta-like n=1 Tax=Mytilus californianus TaxID=6549 RepID=UPI00224549BF|nr:translocon-associated protein subunit delta-like [Mytilus californianus]